jgi:hypothetical protein
MASQTNGSTAQVSSPWPAAAGVSRTELDPTTFLRRSAPIHPERVGAVDNGRWSNCA